VDTTAVVGTDAFRACLEEVAADDGVDAVLAVAVPTAVCDLRAAIASAAVGKPVAAALLDQAESVRLLGEPPPGNPGAAGRPVGDHPAVAARPAYDYPEKAARALSHAARYRAWRERPQGHVPDLGGIRAAAARELVGGYLAGRPAGGWLPTRAAADLLGCYQIPVITTVAADGEQEAVRAAAKLGGRVVLKAEADGVVHKTDAGAVKLDLRSEAEIAAAYRALTSRFGSRLQRVLVQPMLTGGVEVLIGVGQEPVFGPLVVFGVGGVATDVLGDRAARLTPLTDADADELLHAVHAAPLLFGHRGAPPADTAALADALLRVSRLADDLPEIAELDLNPVLAAPDGICAVDVRVRISPAQPRDPFLRRLR
jgi:acyl-CoA synthetase (NDP forming)